MTQDELVQAINNHQKEVAVERGGIGLTSVEAVVFAYNLALDMAEKSLLPLLMRDENKETISKLKIE